MRASDIRRGQAVIIDGKLFVVTNADHNTPGNLRAKVQFKLRDVTKGTIMDKRVGATEDIETANLDRRPVEYLYSDNEGHILMDLDTYDQNTIPKEVFGDDALYLKPNTQFTGRSSTIPKLVSLRITQDGGPEGGRDPAGHQGSDRDQSAEGRDDGDWAQDARSAIYRGGRNAAHQHRNRGIPEPGLIDRPITLNCVISFLGGMPAPGLGCPNSLISAERHSLFAGFSFLRVFTARTILLSLKRAGREGRGV